MGEAQELSQTMLSRRAIPLQGIKEFLKNSQPHGPGSATAYSSALNAVVSASVPREPHR